MEGEFEEELSGKELSVKCQKVEGDKWLGSHI